MKNPLLSAFVIAVLVLETGLVANVNTGVAQISTNVNGVISSDTTWTKVGSPYVLTAPLGVAKDVTLRIEPGVTVNIGDYYLQVNGTLYARGSSSDKIVFNSNPIYYINNRISFTDSSTSWNEQTGTGSIIENAVINYSPIRIGKSSPRVFGNSFYDTSAGGLIHVHGGSPVISNNTMNFNGNSISVSEGGSTVISNNIMKGSSSSSSSVGISDGGDTSFTIYNNRISDCRTAIWSSKATITGNVIENNEIGIDGWFGNTEIIGNIIQNNEHGIKGGGIIRNNTIANNVIAIENSVASSEISYNNIVGYSNSSVYMTKSWNIDARNNWWGTTSTESIKQSIHDFEDNFSLGKVIFEPFLMAPNPSITAEGLNITVTPAPTPNPTPEPSSTQKMPILALACSSSTSSSDFKVEISGRLITNGAGIANVPVLLSYSNNNGESWSTLTTVYTGINGDFSTVWLASTADNYLLKAVWAGDSEYSAATATVSFAVTPFEQNVFSVATNSTLSELFFDSANRELKFLVEGPEGTTGYVNVYIAKSFMNDVSGLKVHLDNNQIACTTESHGDSWLLSFTYSHSSHQVAINMGTVFFDENLVGQILIFALPLTAIALFFGIRRVKGRKPKVAEE